MSSRRKTGPHHVRRKRKRREGERRLKIKRSKMGVIGHLRLAMRRMKRSNPNMYNATKAAMHGSWSHVFPMGGWPGDIYVGMDMNQEATEELLGRSV